MRFLEALAGRIHLCIPAQRLRRPEPAYSPHRVTFVSQIKLHLCNHTRCCLNLTTFASRNNRNPHAKSDTVTCTTCTRRPMAGDIQLTCSDCGQDFTFTAADQAFFQERGYSTPKRCKPCRMAKKNDQGGGGSGYRSAPAQGTPVICSGCGQPTTVPFEPRGDRPVFCRDCYQARKGSSPAGAGARGGRGRY